LKIRYWQLAGEIPTYVSRRLAAAHRPVAQEWDGMFAVYICRSVRRDQIGPEFIERCFAQRGHPIGCQRSYQC